MTPRVHDADGLQDQDGNVDHPEGARRSPAEKSVQDLWRANVPPQVRVSRFAASRCARSAPDERATRWPRSWSRSSSSCHPGGANGVGVWCSRSCSLKVSSGDDLVLGELAGGGASGQVPGTGIQGCQQRGRQDPDEDDQRSPSVRGFLPGDLTAADWPLGELGEDPGSTECNQVGRSADNGVDPGLLAPSPGLPAVLAVHVVTPATPGRPRTPRRDRPGERRLLTRRVAAAVRRSGSGR